MTNANSAQAILGTFKKHLVEDGKSTSTVQSYVGDIEGFLSYLESKGLPFSGELKRFHVTNYRAHLVEANFSTATINKKVNSLQSFNGFLMDADFMRDQVVDLRKDKVRIAAGSEGEVEVFSDEDVEKILFYANTSLSARDKMIIYLLLYTGVRVSELTGIRLKNIDFLTMQLTIMGKGGKQREIPLKPEVVEAIKEYMEKERKHHEFRTSDYLILTQRNGVITMNRDAVNKILRKVASALGIKANPHKFRHTFCTRLLKKGVDIATVSRLAGHTGIQTTVAFYINTSRQDKMEAINRL